MTLAKIELAKGDKQSLRKAMELANELCQDGWEVEEAKALIRDIRARMGEPGFAEEDSFYANNIDDTLEQ